MNPLVVALGIGAALLVAKSSSRPATLGAVEAVTGGSGKAWKVALIGVNGDVKTYDIFAPAGSWGPHLELPVLRYTQTGGDRSSRHLVAVHPNVPAEIAAGAKSDFGIP